MLEMSYLLHDPLPQSIEQNVRDQLRGLVYSLRPSVAVSVGLGAPLGDCLTLHGSFGWLAGISLVSRSHSLWSARFSGGFSEWLAFEQRVEPLRWKTAGVLLSTLGGSLSAAFRTRDSFRWDVWAANLRSFETQAMYGAAQVTSDDYDVISELLCGLSYFQPSAQDEEAFAAVNQTMTQLREHVRRDCSTRPGPPLVPAEYRDLVRWWLAPEQLPVPHRHAS